MRLSTVVAMARGGTRGAGVAKHPANRSALGAVCRVQQRHVREARRTPLEAFDGNAAEMLVAADMPRTVIAA